MVEHLPLEKYTLEYRPTRTGETSFLLIPENDSLSTQYSRRLIYIVKNKDDFIYVGEAKSKLKTRFQRSFTSYRHYKRTNKARGGYKGYKWIELIEPGTTQKVLEVWVVLFSEEFNDRRDDIEAIEGELVFSIRDKTGKWPLYQNEIHFNNDSKDATRVALNILNRIK